MSSGLFFNWGSIIESAVEHVAWDIAALRICKSMYVTGALRLRTRDGTFSFSLISRIKSDLLFTLTLISS
jgi:hypothetical protein